MKALMNQDIYPDYSRSPIAEWISKEDWNRLKEGKEVTVSHPVDIEKNAPGLFSFRDEPVVNVTKKVKLDKLDRRNLAILGR